MIESDFDDNIKTSRNLKVAKKDLSHGELKLRNNFTFFKILERVEDQNNLLKDSIIQMPGHTRGGGHCRGGHDRGCHGRGGHDRCHARAGGHCRGGHSRR